MLRPGRLFAAALLGLSFFLATTGIALADNCSGPEDTRRCNAAVNTAAGGAAIAAGAGAAATAVRNGKNGNGGGKRPPCADQEDRMTAASAEAKVIQASLQNLRGMLNSLDEMYENSRSSSFWSGAIDVAMLGGSVWAKPAQAALGITVKQTLQQKVIESMLKGFGKEIAKDVVRISDDQDIKLEDLLKKPGESGAKKALLDALKESITSRKMQELLNNGLRAGDFRGATFDIMRGPTYEKIRKSITDRLAAPITDAIGNMLDLYKLSDGVISGRKKLEAIRELMSKVRGETSDLESQMEDAMSEMDLARAALNHCREINAPGVVAGG